MADYGQSAGAIYSHGGQVMAENLRHGFDALARQHAAAQKEQQDASAVQGLLDMAKRFQMPDAKTGKPQNVFKDEHIQAIQRMIDQKQYKAAGAAEAAIGIGKDFVNRYQTAYAKQSAAVQKAQQQQQVMQQGPITTTDSSGRRYIYNPHTGAYQTDTAMPRNAAGQTTEEQQKLQLDMQAKLDAQQKLQRDQYSKLLGSMNLSPQALFNPQKQEKGTFVQGRGFLSAGDVQPSPGAPPTDPTHVRIGYQPASTEVFKAGNKKGQPVNPGNPGRVLSMDELHALQDTQAQLAGPDATNAWAWLNTSPDKTQTDFNGNPWTEDSIDQYKKLYPKVQARFAKDVAQGFEVPKQEVTTTTAPATPPTAAFSTEPVAPLPAEDTGDQSQVSDEAADQNPGY